MGAAEHLAGIWDEERRSSVGQAILGTGLPFAPAAWERSAATLDDYAQAWTAMHTEVCAATTIRGEQSAEVMDLRMACLHRARVSLQATTEVLADADADVVQRAHEVVAGLRDLGRCADVEALRAEVEPPPPEEAGAVAEIRALLAEARAERDAFRYGRAQAKADEAQAKVTAIEYGPVHAEVALERARALKMLGDTEGSEAAFRMAIERAATWNMRETLHEAVVMSMYAIGYEQVRPKEALQLRELALGLSEGLDDEARAWTRSTLGAVLGRLGDYEGSTAQHQQALALWRAVNPRHPRIAMVHAQLGGALSASGKLVDAEAAFRRAVEHNLEILGHEHPGVATSRFNLARVLIEQRRYIDAEAELREAIVSSEKALGAEHPAMATWRTGLGEALIGQRRYAEAEAELRAALALRERALRPGHRAIAQSHQALAHLFVEQGRYDEAEAELRGTLAAVEEAAPDEWIVTSSRLHFATSLAARGEYASAELELRKALATLEAQLGPEDPDLGVLLTGLGEILDEQGKHEEAEATARRGLALLEGSLAPDDPRLASAWTCLARILLARGRETDALELAERAWARHGRQDARPEDRAAAALVLARTLWAAPSSGVRERERALELAREAQAAYLDAAPRYAAEAAEADAWVISRERSPR